MEHYVKDTLSENIKEVLRLKEIYKERLRLLKEKNSKNNEEIKEEIIFLNQLKEKIDFYLDR